jgi:hypothetical protein
LTIAFVAECSPVNANARHPLVANSIVRPGACGWANAIVRAVRGLACQDGRHAQGLSADLAWASHGRVNVAEVEREAGGSTLPVRLSLVAQR